MNLKHAISAADLEVPVIGASLPGRNLLVDRHHRLCQARKAGLPTAPAHRLTIEATRTILRP